MGANLPESNESNSSSSSEDRAIDSDEPFMDSSITSKTEVHLHDEKTGKKKKQEFTKKNFKESAKYQFRTIFGLTDFIKKVVRTNGIHFTWLLTLQYFGIKGIMAKYMDKMMYPYFSEELHVEPSISTRARAVGLAPMAMKGVIGIFSDSFPIFGYNKNPYILIGAILSLAGLFILLLTPYAYAARNTALPIIAIFMIHVHVASGDLMCQGKYSEFMRYDKQSIGETIVYTYSLVEVGALIVAASAASISTNVGVWLIFAVTIPVVIISTIPSIIGWFPEERTAPSKRNRIDYQKLKKYKQYFSVALALGIASVINVVISLSLPTEAAYYNLYIRIAIVAAIVIVLSLACWFLLPRMISKCVLFMLLKDAVYPDITRLTEAFYLADPECVPNGPHFSLLYYQTYTGLLGIFMGLVGYMVFQRLSRYVTFRSVFIITISLCVLGGFVDLIMIKRWNLAMGIPDEVMYIIGDAIIFDLIVTLNEMPGSIMISRLCPPTVETTAFAILAGFNNFGTIIGGFIAEVASEVGKISNQGVCNFTALPMIVVITHMLLPLLIIPASYFMLPGIPLSKSLLEYDEERKMRATAKGRVIPKSDQYDAGVHEDDAHRRDNLV